VSSPLRLVGDVGGTHARFGLVDPAGEVVGAVELPSSDYHDLGSAAEDAVARLQSPRRSAGAVREAALAVAGPVTGDRVELTNVAWSFSVAETRAGLGLERLEVLNDVAAVAWALPDLPASFWTSLAEGEDRPDQPRAVVSVGTGLGVATAAAPTRDRPVVLASEGGHRDLAATTEREWRVVERLSVLFGGHVSAERAVSGSGLASLHAALCELDGERAEPIDGAEVSRRADAGAVRSIEALALFSAWLGAFAGDLALTVGARGGVYLSGGVLPALGQGFDRAAFRERFLAKGRFRSWLERVPLRLITDERTAFRGLARRLDAPP
jgi:glucokinase